MADQPSFLASLGVSPVDEKDAVTAQRDKLLSDVERSAKAQGQTAGRGVAGLLSGAGSIIRNRSFAGSQEAAVQGFNEATDRDVAEASGLTVDQLRGRREMRQLSTAGANSGSFDDRINLSRQIANIANRSGDSEVLGAALKRMTDLRTEKTEFDKLKAVTTQEESAAEESDVITAFLDGAAVDGTLATSPDGRKGLEIANEQGQLQFVPWGERLTRNDPNVRRGAAPRTDAELISGVLGKSQFNSVRESLTANAGVLRKYDTILSRLQDASIRGNVQSIIGNAGAAVSFLDNTVRSIRGVLSTFVTGKTFARDSDLLNKWRETGKNPNDAIWDQIQLPVGVTTASAEAQQYRAGIIELAYLSARAAEPSNRGLSDNDIKNALLRLGADSANPAVLFRRSMEVVAGGANDINDRLQTHYSAYKRRDGTTIGDTDIDRILGGRALSSYRTDIAKVYDKFNVTITTDGRAIFEDAVDVDVNPIEQAPERTPDEIEQDLLKQISEQLGALPGTA